MSSNDFKNTNKLNYINVSRDGNFHKTGKVQTIPKDIDNIIQHIKDKPEIKKILIHFHGGLNNEDSGMESAECFYNNFKEVKDTLAVTVVWETGIDDVFLKKFKNEIELIDDFIDMIVKVGKFIGKKFKKEDINLDKDSPINKDFFKTIMEHESGFEGEYLEKSNLNNKLKSYYNKKNFQPYSFSSLHKIIFQEITGSKLTKKKRLEFLSKDKRRTQDKVNAAAGGWTVSYIASRCLWRILKGRNHGIWPTIIEEVCIHYRIAYIGANIWDSMKSQAKVMWKSNSGLKGIDQYAGRYFLDRLNEHCLENNLEIHVVGHSAGAIAVCEWLLAITKESDNYVKFKFNNIIFLAPACRCDLFNSAIIDIHDSSHYSRKFYHRFRMFTMDDEHESHDNLIKIPILKYIYPRSLLYLISGILEFKKVKKKKRVAFDAFIGGLERHITLRSAYKKKKLLRKVAKFLELNNSEEIRLVTSPSNYDSSKYPDRQTTATHHGGFAKNCEVVSSIKSLIKN